MTELAVLAANPTALDAAADPAAFVVLACERAKEWLAQALAHGEIEQIVELKSQAEAIRVYTAQKQMGHDAELAAAEIVRRAERGIGVAIRRGQEAGGIAKPGDVGGRPRPGVRGSDPGEARGQHLDRPTDFLGRDELSNAAYPLTDGVSDDQFDSALEEAKAEGNLSRANVVRKVKGVDPPKTTRPELLRRTRRHDPNRIVEQTVQGLEGYCLGLDLIDFAGIDSTRIDGWTASLRQSLRRLNRLVKELDV